MSISEPLEVRGTSPKLKRGVRERMRSSPSARGRHLLWCAALSTLLVCAVQNGRAFAQAHTRSIVGGDRPPMSPDALIRTEATRKGDAHPFKPGIGGPVATHSGQAPQKAMASLSLQRPKDLTWLPDDQREPLVPFSPRVPGVSK